MFFDILVNAKHYIFSVKTKERSAEPRTGLSFSRNHTCCLVTVLCMRHYLLWYISHSEFLIKNSFLKLLSQTWYYFSVIAIFTSAFLWTFRSHVSINQLINQSKQYISLLGKIQHFITINIYNYLQLLSGCRKLC